MYNIYEELLCIDGTILDWLAERKKNIKYLAGRLAWKVFAVLAFITWPLWSWARNKMYEHNWPEEAQDD